MSHSDNLNPNHNPNFRMNDETDLPCPVCGARSGENQCPLQPQWSDPEAMAHLCSSGLDGDKQDFWEAAVMHYASEGHLVSNVMIRVRVRVGVGL